MNEDKSKKFRIKVRETLMQLEEYLYYLVALGLIIGFIIVMTDGFIILMNVYKSASFSEGAIKFLDKILVSLIFLEVFYTVIVAILEESAIKCVEPFILIAITALVRRLLILSFEISHPVEFSSQRMNYFLIELALVGFLILLLMLTLILFRRSKKQ